MNEIATYRSTEMVMMDPVTDSWTAVVDRVAAFAGQIAHTEFVPNSLRGQDGAKVAAAILTGRELGLPPMTALSSIHVINGKPGISAEMMRALVLQAGHKIVVSESSSQRVVIKGRRDDAGEDEWTTVTWTDQDANRAGLKGGNYAKYPRQMLAARATTELCRLLFADVIHGLRSIEELEGMGDEIADVAPDGAADGASAQPVKRKRREPKVQPVDAEQGDQPEKPARRSASLTRRGAGTQTAAGSGDDQPGTTDAPDEATDPAASEPVASAVSVRAARKLFDDLGYDTPTRVATSNEVAGREIAKLGELTEIEAIELIETLTSRLAERAEQAEHAPQTGEESVERKTSDDSSPPLPEDEPAGEPDDDGIVDAEVIDDPAAAEPRISSLQRPKLMAMFSELDVKDRAERLSVMSDLTGRTIESTNELSISEATSIIDTLDRCDTRDDLESVIQSTIAHREGRES